MVRCTYVCWTTTYFLGELKRLRALTLTFQARVEGGQLDLEFVQGPGDPLISAIAIKAFK